MSGELTEMELRCMEAVARHKAGPLALTIARAVIAEMRLPTDDMLKAMQSAIWKSGLARSHHVNSSLKHRMRWIAAVDAASPQAVAAQRQSAGQP